MDSWGVWELRKLFICFLEYVILDFIAVTSLGISVTDVSTTVAADLLLMT